MKAKRFLFFCFLKHFFIKKLGVYTKFVYICQTKVNNTFYKNHL